MWKELSLTKPQFLSSVFQNIDLQNHNFVIKLTQLAILRVTVHYIILAVTQTGYIANLGSTTFFHPATVS